MEFDLIHTYTYVCMYMYIPKHTHTQTRMKGRDLLGSYARHTPRAKSEPRQTVASREFLYLFVFYFLFCFNSTHIRTPINTHMCVYAHTYFLIQH